MQKLSAISNIGGILLALFTIACRFSHTLADWYAEAFYPIYSASLSWIASFTTISLQDIALLVLFLLLVGIVVQGVRKKGGVWHCLRQIGILLLWTYVWFYLGWCTNYNEVTYDAFLKGNSIPDGRRNYSEVVGMLLSPLDFAIENIE